MVVSTTHKRQLTFAVLFYLVTSMLHFTKKRTESFLSTTNLMAGSGLNLCINFRESEVHKLASLFQFIV